MAGFSSSHKPNREGGFVLITAVWLLILGGLIVAVLMMRSMTNAVAATRYGQALEQKLALESAFNIVFADRLFHGSESNWWFTPATGTILIDDQLVEISLTSESGRIDLNEADPILVERALRGLGVSAPNRAAVLEQLRSRRLNARPIASFSEVRQLFAGSDAVCLEDHFTISSGLAEPRTAQMSQSLSTALALPGSSVSRSPPEPGTALRFAATLKSGGSLFSIGRLTAQAEKPIAIHSWSTQRPCARSKS